MNLKRPLYGPQDPRGPSHGRDVKDFVKRSLNKVETNFFPKPPGGFTDLYNAKTAEAITALQRANHIRPTGNMGDETFDLLWREYADAYAKWVYRTWNAPTPKPVPPEIEPMQGWASLDSSLHDLFSLGRSLKLSDLGTFNPSSTLPSGAPSDHALWPALAFDLGVDPDNGWDNDVGRAFFYTCKASSVCGYVILGDRIWSRARAAEGVRHYSGGGHGNHIHVSGRR